MAYAGYSAFPKPTSCVFTHEPAEGVVVVPVASTKHRLGSDDAAHAAVAAAWSAPWSVHVASATGQIVSDRRRVPAVRSSALTLHCCEAGSVAQCASASLRFSKPVHCEKAHGVSGGGAAGGATSQWQTTLAAPAGPSIPPLTHT